MMRNKLENDRRNNLLTSINDPNRFRETLKSAKPRIQSYANYIDGDKRFAYLRNLFTTQERAGLPSTQLRMLQYLTTLLKPKSQVV